MPSTSQYNCIAFTSQTTYIITYTFKQNTTYFTKLSGNLGHICSSFVAATNHRASNFVVAKLSIVDILRLEAPDGQ